MSQVKVKRSSGPAIVRRRFLQGITAAVPMAYLLPSFIGAQDSDKKGSQPATSGGLIVRKSDPENLEMPFQTLDGFQTPNDKFYIRNHFAIPKLDADSWRLKIDGAVNQSLELSLAEIMKLPSRTQSALLECAGNGRAFLDPKAKGVQWESGAVGNAEWTGVPLSAVLAKAGVRDPAVEVILEGADTGEITEEPKSPGRIHFARSVPLAKANSDVLLAYQMNGEPLPASHGFPLRAVVPGWYGMASVKWLTRIIIATEPFQGYFQSLDYTYFQRIHGLPTLVPVTQLEIKSQIARPAPREIIPSDRPYRMHGAAWGGESGAAKVEVSTDGGKTWSAATVLGEAKPNAWRLWEFNWKAPRKGSHKLMARATDGKGRTQPMKRDPDRRGYMISHVLPIEVEVAT